jgi:hypothetical protein
LGIWLVFADGIGRFSSRSKRMKDHVFEINRRLTFLRTPTRIIDYHHSTGSIVVQTPKTSRLEVRDELSLALGVSCAVLRIDEVEKYLSVAEKAENPPSETGIRWTKGIAFEVKGKPITMTPQSTPRAAFFQINGFAIGIYNRGKITSSEVSDTDEHAGGWRAISEYISKAVGGKWTARSLVIVQGLFEKARTHLT